MKKILIPIVLFAAVATAGCQVTDGKVPLMNDSGVYLTADGGVVSSQSCTVDSDCGKGRHCNGYKLCAIDCVSSKDCSYFLKNPNDPNNMFCSECGRCIEKGLSDLKCQGKKDLACDNTAFCVAELSERYQCGKYKYCTTTCKKDADCNKYMGRGFGCMDGVCGKACTWDVRCYFFGWDYKCDLPEGMDQFKNTYPELSGGGTPVVSECILNPKGVDWGSYVDKSKNSFEYSGIWAMQLVTTVRSTGTPLVDHMNTASNQLLLMKLTQGAGGGIAMTYRWCSFNLLNFMDPQPGQPDEEYTAAKMITPDRYADWLPVMTNPVLVPVPAMEPGVIFNTEKFYEIRGAILANPMTDPLPDYANCPKGNCSFQWDQDKDGNPGMTTMMTGIVGSGEIYNSQRWFMQPNINVGTTDYMEGLVFHNSDQKVISATNSSAEITLVYEMHPDKDRSYFRAMRLDDSANCEDVIKLGATGGPLQYIWHCTTCK
ncbi:MAG: hypothetical protein WC889_06345 [Myxococcota bacterium]|jgi:hypothetical protein